MIKRIIMMKFREKILFRSEFFSMILRVFIYVLSLLAVWKIISDFTFFKFEDAVLFLTYQSFTFFIMDLFFNCFRYLPRIIREGKLTLYLLYPVDPLKFLFYNVEVKPEPLIGTLILFSIYSSFHSLSLNIFFGFLICILGAFTFLSLLFLLSVIGIRGESDIQDLIDDISTRMGAYPTYLYKGIAFIIANFIFPAFALGTYQFLVAKGILKSLILYFTLYSVFFIIFSFSLGILLFKRFLKEYKAYGG